MKYLYKILRLFFCPHKYTKLLAQGKTTAFGETVGMYYDKQCCYCGKVREFRT